MNKVISVLSAVFLGVLVMAFPLLLIAPVYQHSQTEVAPAGGEALATDLKEENNATEAYRESEALGREMGGIMLSNITYVGLIVTFGVLVALGVSLYAKKKILPFASRLFCGRPNL